MKHKILIIDDEEGVRESLKLILGDDYDLILTCNADEGFEALKNSQSSIPLVFIDIKMPQTNGLDALTEIKKLYPKIKVIIVTGYQFSETVAEAVSRGADGYIVKPFKSEKILETAEKYIN